VVETTGSKEPSKKSLRPSMGEFEGRFIGGAGGVSVRGAGRRRSRPLGFDFPADRDEKLGTIGAVGLKTMSTRNSGL